MILKKEDVIQYVKENYNNMAFNKITYSGKYNADFLSTK